MEEIKSKVIKEIQADRKRLLDAIYSEFSYDFSDLFEKLDIELTEDWHPNDIRA